MTQARAPKFMLGGQFAPTAVGAGSSAVSNPRQEAYQGRKQNMDAASGLKAMFVKEGVSQGHRVSGSFNLYEVPVH